MNDSPDVSAGNVSTQKALQTALEALAVFKLTDAEKPYSEISQDYRRLLLRAHDEVLSALSTQKALPVEAYSGSDGWQYAIADFVNAILHGDDVHKDWLREAGEAFILRKPLPAARDGKGATDLVDLLRAVGYGVVEGRDAVLAAIAERSDGSTELLCSGYGVFPDGKRCGGCRDCNQKEALPVEAA